MKTRLLPVVVVILALFLSAGISIAQSTAAVGTVTTSWLNVRAAPSAHSQIIGTLQWGYSAGVIGKNSDSTWYQLILQGGYGWVNGQYLSVTNAHTVPVTNTVVSPPSSLPVVAGGLVNTGALHIRPIPSPTNNVPLASVPLNTPLTIVARNTDNSWFKVTTSNNVQGWVRSKYVSVTSGDVNSLPIQTENPPIVPVSAQGYVNTGALNIRSVPSPTNNVPLAYIPNGTGVNIIGRTQDSQWYQISVNTTVGWVRGKYITITSGAVANVPVTG